MSVISAFFLLTWSVVIGVPATDRAPTYPKREGCGCSMESFMPPGRRAAIARRTPRIGGVCRPVAPRPPPGPTPPLSDEPFSGDVTDLRH